MISIRILFRRAANEYSDLGEGRYEISKSHVYVRQEAYSDELPVVQVSYDDGNPVIRSLPVRPMITFLGFDWARVAIDSSLGSMYQFSCDVRTSMMMFGSTMLQVMTADTVITTRPYPSSST